MAGITIVLNFFLVCTLLLPPFASIVSASSAHDECAALSDIYGSLNGSTWIVPWNASAIASASNCCALGLHGVVCDPLTDRVVELSLPSNNLAGQFPGSVCTFSVLQNLDLSGNAISAKRLPVCLFGLSFLRRLDLSKNLLEGELFTFSSQRNLTYIDVSFNLLNGTLSSSHFDALSNLTLLNLVRNNFGGQVSHWIHSLKSAKAVYLDRNTFSGEFAWDIRDGHPLERLSLSSNFFTGCPTVQATVNNSLSYLNLASNNFSCNSSFLTNLTSLEYLNVAQNGFFGGLSNWVCEMRRLRVLDVKENKLSDALPQCIGNLTMLESMDVSSNLFFGQLPETLGNLQALKSLLLFANRFDGCLPASLGKLRLLERLLIHSCGLQCSLPESLGNLSRLTVLYAFGNGFSGPIPSTFGALSALKEMLLFSNQLSGPIPESLGNLSVVENLYLFSNMLTGTIPASIGLLPMLKDLQLQANYLSGSLSDYVFTAPIASLNLALNNFTGSIPHSICGLAGRLSFLYLSNNHFSEFPVCVFHALLILDVSVNRLQSFPFRAALYFPSLAVLDVSFNLLSGDFPLPLFTADARLRSLSLAYNRFQGDLPIYPCGYPDVASGTVLPINLANGLMDVDVSGNIVTGIPGYFDFNACARCQIPYASLSILRMSSSAIPLQFPSKYVTFGNRSCLVASAPLSYFLPFFRGLKLLDLSNNSLGGDLQLLFDNVPLLNGVDIRNNPSANLSALAKDRITTLFTFSSSSAYPYSKEMTCFMPVTASGRLQLLTDPSFFFYKNCYCRPGYFGKPPHCRPCLSSHASCSFASDSDASLLPPLETWSESGNVLANDGYFASPETAVHLMKTDTAYPQTVEICANAGSSLTPCKASHSASCVPGYESRLCSRCSRLYFKSGDRCVRCPEGVGLIFFGIAIVCVISVIFVWSYFVGSSSSGIVKILIFFLQTLSFCKVPMPEGLYLLTQNSSSSMMGSIPGPECFIDGWDFERSFITALLIPPFLCLATALIYCIGCLKIVCASSTGGMTKWKDTCTRSLLFLYAFFFVNTVNNVLPPLACANDSGDGNRYIISVPHALCEDWVQTSAGIGFAVYVVCIPFVFCIHVWKSGVLSGNPNVATAAVARQRFICSFFFAPYRNDCRFWEVLVYMKRVIVVSAFAAVSPLSAFRIFLLGFIFTACVVLQSAFLPYKNRWDNVLDVCSVALLSWNMMLKLQSDAIGVVDTNSMGIVIFCINLVFTAMLCTILLRRIFSQLKRRHAVHVQIVPGYTMFVKGP
eukprot:ANDGO_03677.mRNA.1 Leucine-rich repeat receptor protein kinase MSL1